MQSSGVEWLGEIPCHWQLVRFDSVLAERQEKNTELVTNNILSLMKDVGVIRYKDKGNIGNKSSDRPENYKLVYPNDLVLNSMNLYIGSVGISRELGVTSSVYIVCHPKGSCVDVEFFHGVIRDRGFQSFMGSLGDGILEIRRAVKYKDLKVQLLPLPPLAEQRAIAAYLDRETAKIDALIASTERLNALLGEKRTALISRAVTKGLDPSVEMKDSGVEWLGEIPCNWEVKRVNYVVQVNPKKSELRGTPNEHEVTFLPMPAIGEKGELDLDQVKQIQDVFEGYTYFREEDVIVAKITPCFENGKGAIARRLCNGIGFGTTELFVLRPYSDVFSDFIYYVTASSGFRKLGAISMQGAAGQKRITDRFVREFQLGSPAFDSTTSNLCPPRPRDDQNRRAHRQKRPAHRAAA